jgi:5-methyltetrahydropteroyltriglutamate--homocysteine methyltransferase
MDVRFREKFQDALATVISDQERAGLDILTHGDLHCDDDMAGRSWHHYPLQRWAGFDGDYLQSEAMRSPWLRYPPGSMLNEIYTGWRWPRVVDKVEHRPLDYAKIWRMAQAKTNRPVRFGTCCSQVMGLFLDLHTPKYKDNQEVVWDMAVAMNKELLALRDAGCKCIQIEEPTLHFWANTFGRDHDNVKFHGQGLQPRSAGPGRCRNLDSHLLVLYCHSPNDIWGIELVPMFIGFIGYALVIAENT